MSKKKKSILIILGIMLIIAFITGISYALWIITKVQSNPNRISTGCFDIELVEESSGIKLLNTFPISDEDGLNTTPYTFTIENTCTIDAKYVINLEVFQTSTLSSNYVKAVIDQNTPEIITSYKKTNPTLANTDSYQLSKGSLNAHEKQTFSLRLWMDEDTPQTEENKTFSAKMVIEAGITVPEIYADESGAEAPELDNGMIPVVYKDNPWEKQWVKADTSSKWYDYDNQIWANAVTVSAETRETYINAAANTPINMDDIETMWVWIPRYEYQHTNLSTQYAGGTRELPGGIEINFISKETITPLSDNFTIHDAFWWDDNNDGKKDANEQLAGIWVAKFEMSTGVTECTPAANDVETGCDIITINPQIKPNVTSWRGARIGTFWTAIHNNMNGTDNTYGITNSDAHLMKNIEWGAVAYLSQSKYGKYGNPNYEGANKEIYQNKSEIYITGNSNGTPSQTDYNIQATYDIEEKGTGASTTGNIYGIYDMSGGVEEYVMGIQAVENSDPLEPMVGNSESDNSGWSGKIYDSKNWTDYTGIYGPLKDIGSKYYDLYTYSRSSNITNARAHKGDATYETTGWYSDYASFVYSDNSFFTCGYGFGADVMGGVFSKRSRSGNKDMSYSGRPVIIQTN